MQLSRLWGVALLAMAGPASAQEERTPSDCAGLAANSVEAAILHCGGEVTDPAAAALLGQDPLREAPSSIREPLAGIGSEFTEAVVPTPDPTVVDVSGEGPAHALLAPRAGPLVQIDGEQWAAEQQRARSSVAGAAGPAARGVFWQAPPRLVPLTPTAEPHAQVDGQMVSADDWLEGSFLDRVVDLVPAPLPNEDRAPALPPLAVTMRAAVIDGVTVDLDPTCYALLELIRRSAGVADLDEAPAVGAGAREEAGQPDRANEDEQEN